MYRRDAAYSSSGPDCRPEAEPATIWPIQRTSSAECSQLAHPSSPATWQVAPRCPPHGRLAHGTLSAGSVCGEPSSAWWSAPSNSEGAGRWTCPVCRKPTHTAPGPITAAVAVRSSSPVAAPATTIPGYPTVRTSGQFNCGDKKNTFAIICILLTFFLSPFCRRSHLLAPTQNQTSQLRESWQIQYLWHRCLLLPTRLQIQFQPPLLQVHSALLAQMSTQALSPSLLEPMAYQLSKLVALVKVHPCSRHRMKVLKISKLSRQNW